MFPVVSVAGAAQQDVRFLKNMKKWLRISLYIVLGLPVVFVALVWVAGTAYYYGSGEAEFAGKFEKVKIGESKTNVLSMLGEPNHKDKEFRLGQKEGFEAAYQRAEKSNSSYYLFWHRGIDTVYTIGFDAQEKATITESGGT